MALRAVVRAPSAPRFDPNQLGYNLFATDKTAKFITDNGLPVTELNYPDAANPGENNIDEYISRGDIHLVLMFSNQFSERILLNYAIRRLAVDFGVPLITNIQVAEMFATALDKAGATATGDLPNSNVVLDSRSLQAWYE